MRKLQPNKSARKPRSPKKKSVSSLKRIADAYFSKYIRLRDADRYGYCECISCGVKKHWKDMQNGHFVKRSVSLLRYDDENCNAQCLGCNMFKSGEQYAYSLALDLKYGDGTASRLHKQRHTTHKFTISELESIIEECKSNIKWMQSV